MTRAMLLFNASKRRAARSEDSVDPATTASTSMSRPRHAGGLEDCGSEVLVWLMRIQRVCPTCDERLSRKCVAQGTIYQDTRKEGKWMENRSLLLEDVEELYLPNTR